MMNLILICKLKKKSFYQDFIRVLSNSFFRKIILFYTVPPPDLGEAKKKSDRVTCQMLQLAEKMQRSDNPADTYTDPGVVSCSGDQGGNFVVFLKSVLEAFSTTFFVFKVRML